MKPLQLPSSLVLIALSNFLLAISMLLLGPGKQITTTTDFFQISHWLSANHFNYLAVLAFITSSVLAVIAIKVNAFRTMLGYLLIIVSVTPLVSLAADSMWIASMGGFPVIGSGQGVIKYFALLAIGVMLLKPRLTPLTSAWLSALPVVIVLLWIGGMKFTLIEAQGIEGLVQSSPLMSWLYTFFSVQTTSNIIGFYDLIAAALLIVAIYKPKLRAAAIIMSGLVFIVTQTFLFSYSAALSSDTVLSATGHFLIKDLWYLACLLCYHLALTQYKNDSP